MWAMVHLNPSLFKTLHLKVLFTFTRVMCMPSDICNAQTFLGGWCRGCLVTSRVNGFCSCDANAYSFSVQQHLQRLENKGLYIKLVLLLPTGKAMNSVLGLRTLLSCSKSFLCSLLPTIAWPSSEEVIGKRPPFHLVSLMFFGGGIICRCDWLACSPCGVCLQLSPHWYQSMRLSFPSPSVFIDDANCPW